MRDNKSPVMRQPFRDTELAKRRPARAYCIWGLGVLLPPGCLGKAGLVSGNCRTVSTFSLVPHPAARKAARRPAATGHLSRRGRPAGRLEVIVEHLPVGATGQPANAVGVGVVAEEADRAVAEAEERAAVVP